MTARSPLATALLAGILTVAATTSCTRCGGDTAAFPRPEAYPRIEMPDSSYVTIDLPGLPLKINRSAGAKVRAGESGGAWVDISYNVTGIPTVYVTLTETSGAGETADVIGNRRERMRLNLGGNRAVLTELVSADGWECELMVSRTTLNTPVQFIAHKDSRVLSGALVITMPDNFVDQGSDPTVAAPVIDAVERDMLEMLKAL